VANYTAALSSDLTKRQLLQTQLERATCVKDSFFYEIWDICLPKPESLTSDLACFWPIPASYPPLSGTLSFLEIAIVRWTTWEIPSTLSFHDGKELTSAFTQTVLPTQTAREDVSDLAKKVSDALTMLKEDNLY
jgi:hypothetical protein